MRTITAISAKKETASFATGNFQLINITTSKLVAKNAPKNWVGKIAAKNQASNEEMYAVSNSIVNKIVCAGNGTPKYK